MERANVTLSDDTKLQVLHDHYKDTFVHIRTYIGSRDRLLIFVVAVRSLLSIPMMILYGLFGGEFRLKYLTL